MPMLKVKFDFLSKDLAMREYAVWSWQHLARAKSKNERHPS